MKFTKMQGAGNDYVYVDCTKQEVGNAGRLAVRVSDRHFGIGADGLVLICSSQVADFRMRMFNADGSEAQMCGNASRCVGKYVYDNKLTDKTQLTLETGAGVKNLELTVSAGKVQRVRVDMGIPMLHPAKIPVMWAQERMVDAPVEVMGETFRMTAVSMGNPHAVIFVDRVGTFDVHRWGSLIEKHRLFPEKVNVEFVEVASREELHMRVWERGSGETMACGTGACASLVAAVLNGRTGHRVVVHLLGGDLDVEWNPDTSHVYMSGGAETVFTGDIEL